MTAKPMDDQLPRTFHDTSDDVHNNLSNDTSRSQRVSNGHRKSAYDSKPRDVSQFTDE